MSKQQALQDTRDWIESMVIGLGLCPFAKVPYDQGLVRLKVDRTDAMSMWIKVILDSAHEVDSTPATELSNLLIIFPQGPADFEDYLELVDMAEIIIADQQMNKRIQVASFHPDYRFADVDADDVSNYTNRSPYPMIHLLRVEEVAAAIASHPDIDSVGPANKAKLRGLGLVVIKGHIN